MTTTKMRVGEFIVIDNRVYELARVKERNPARQHWWQLRHPKWQIIYRLFEVRRVPVLSPRS